MSLVEMAVVLVLLGVIATLALPALDGFRDDASDEAAKVAALDVVTAQMTFASRWGYFTSDPADLVVNPQVTVTTAESTSTQNPSIGVGDGRQLAVAVRSDSGTCVAAVAEPLAAGGAVTYTTLDGTCSAATALIPFDTTAPVVAFTAPTGGQAVSGTVTVTSTITDPSPITRTRLFAAGTPVADVAGAATSIAWNTASFADGPVTLELRVTDAAGNEASTTRSVTVDATAPTVAITFPNPGRAVSGTVTVTSTITDVSPIVRTQLFANGAQVADEAGAATSIAWDTAPLPEGQVLLEVRATDEAGNATTSAARTVWIDRTLPTASFTAPAPNATVSGEFTVTAAIADDRALATVRLVVNGVVHTTWPTSGPFTATVSTAGLSGTVELRLRVWDQAGNYLTVSRNVTVS